MTKIKEAEDKDDVLYIGAIDNDVEFVPIIPKSPAEPFRKHQESDGNFVVLKTGEMKEYIPSFHQSLYDKMESN